MKGRGSSWPPLANMNPLKAWKLWRRFNRGYERGERMADKPMVASVTVWGVICTQIPPLMEAVGAFLQHKTPLPDFLEVVAVPIGLIIAAIGARRAVGRALVKKEG